MNSRRKGPSAKPAARIKRKQGRPEAELQGKGRNRPSQAGKKYSEAARQSEAPYRKVEPAEVRQEAPEDIYQLEGKNPVWEALKAEQQIDKLIVDSELAPDSIRGILGAARRLKVRIEMAPKAKLDTLSRTGRHQGLIAMMPAARYVPLEDMLDQAFARQEDPVFVLLDEIQDPHNVGAIIRSAECAGAAGIILTEHRSSGLTAVVARASAGAVAHIPVCRVTNLAAAIDTLKARGIWVWGADMDAPSGFEARLTGPLALVIGGEGKGLRRLVAERCDGLMSIPMRGHTGSLNASVAAGVLLFEAVRQRMAGEADES